MNKGVRFWRAGMLVLLWLGVGTVRATTFLEMQSTYLGDGWFQYRMQVMNDPFFIDASVGQLIINFTNQIDQSTDSSLNWTNNSYANPYSNWTCISNYPSRPNEQTFLMRSSQTGYKTGVWTNLNGAVVTVSLFPSACYPGYSPGSTYSINIVGVAYMPCLIPCRPDESDGSPTNFVYDLKLLPDVQINQLIQTDGVFNGVDFTWGDEATFVLQGGADLTHWTNIAYIWSYPPETAWTSARSLGDYGQFFRLAMVAGIHTTNLPPLNSGLVLAPKALGRPPAAPRVTGCRPAKDKMVVSIATQPNQTCNVQAMNSRRVVIQTRQVTVPESSATVDFDAASLPNPVFFQVVAVQ